MCLKLFLLLNLVLIIGGASFSHGGASETNKTEDCDPCPCPDDQTLHKMCAESHSILPSYSDGAGCVCFCPRDHSIRMHYPKRSPWVKDTRQKYRVSFYQQVAAHRNLTCGGMFFQFYDDSSTLPVHYRRLLYERKHPLVSHSLISESVGNSQYVIFEPEFKFIRDNGFRDIIHKVRQRSTGNYLDKVPKVMWRGSGYSPQWGAHYSARFNLSLASKAYPWCDIGMSTAVTVDQDTWFDDQGVSKPAVPEESWVNYRGIMDVDGTTNAGGLYWRLASGTAIFKVESNWTCSFIEKMKPWEHFIPVKEDMSDLGNVTKIVTIDSFALLLQNIANNAYKLSLEFTLEKELEHLVDNLQRIWSSPPKRRRR